MESLEEMLSWIDSSEQEIIDAMIGMVGIPALAPVNGGNGESAKADYVMGLLKGFDTVERVDVPDDLDPTVMRSNIVCRRNGRSKGTVWTVSHLDVVPAGDPELWDTPPFEPVYRDGRVYGRGTEDNGQSVISTIFASRCFADMELNGMSLGVVFVADEETGSEKGICQLIERGFFSVDDVIIVPDWGSPNGSMVEVMEKSILWLRFRIKGKTTHASSPDEGINAYRVSTRLLSDLMDGFEERFGERDPLFIPDRSTFEPTKRPATVENVNTIPGYDEFCMDIRLLPCHRMEDVMAFIEEVMEKHRRLSGADISVEKLQSNESYGPSSMESAGHAALLDSIEHVTGSRPRDVAVGGGTCANFFRKAGYDAYVWQCGGGTLHAPNEYVVIDDLKRDAKVFVGLFHRLCL